MPGPARVPKENIYQAFGGGGRFSPGNDGSQILGSPVIAAHYSAMISSLRSEDATKMWDWLIAAGHFSPLTNVESLAFQTGSDCTSVQLEWNQLKGSWNLALQTLGWGRYLVKRSGNTPSIWQATKDNLFLRRGCLLLAPNEPEQEMSLILPGQDLTRTIESLSPRCSEEADYKRSLPGMYGYQMTAANGAALYFTITHTKGSQDTQYDSWGWPPKDNSIPPWVSTTTHTQMEDITTRFGTLHALRLDTLQEYRIQTDNHSDPNGTVERFEWYVCGLGLIRGTMDHSGMYVTTKFERKSTLELVSFTPLPELTDDMD